jgi:DNA-binding transcriptional MocR family regulator
MRRRRRGIILAFGATHLVAWLPNGLPNGLPNASTDREVSRRAATAGVSAPPLSAYYHQSGDARPGLLVGYPSVSRRKIPEGGPKTRRRYDKLTQVTGKSTSSTPRRNPRLDVSKSRPYCEL